MENFSLEFFKGTGLKLNPKLKPEQKTYFYELTKALPALDSCYLISSSGSEGDPRLVALSTSHLSIAANSVNNFLKVDPSDQWLRAIPDFHVGGLAVLARAALTHQPCLEQNAWDATDFYELCLNKKVNFSALVPTQVYDLVQKKLSAPKTLKAILVGAAELNQELYFQARSLGWPLLRSYGMSETAAAFAISPLESLASKNYPSLEILGHLKASQGAAGELLIEGPCLARGYLSKNSLGQSVWTDLTEPFKTKDRVKIEGSSIEYIGRLNDEIKVLSERVNLKDIRQKIIKKFKAKVPSKDLAGEVEITSLPDLRKGCRIVAIFSEKINSDDAVEVLSSLNRELLPFEKVEDYCFFSHIPRSELAKPLWGQIDEMMASAKIFRL